MSPRPWPAPLVETETKPDDVAPPWADHVQGIAPGAGSWFITQADRVWRIPMRRQLGSVDEHDPEVVVAGIPEAGIDHLGDCDVHDGSLYVAMEGTDPARIGVFDLDLRFRGAGAVTPQGPKCSWCAVNPVDGLIWSSSFDAAELHAYRLHHAGGELGFEHATTVRLRSESGAPLRLRRVQGGAFSSQGHLFVTSDVRDGGLYGVDVLDGRCRMHVPIPYAPDWPEEDVIEGVAVIDLSGGGAPSMSGVVHVLVIDDRGSRSDHVWLRHFDVADQADRACFNPAATPDPAAAAASG